MKTKHSGLIMGPAAAPQAPAATKFWNMASTGDDEGEITLYGDVMSQQPVDWWTGEPEPGLFITPEGFMEDLAAVKDKGHITVKLNSCGGDLYTGIAIHNALKALSGEVNVIVEGIAASAASVIMCAGDTVTVYPGSLIMIHGVSVMLWDYMNMQDMKRDAFPGRQGQRYTLVLLCRWRPPGTPSKPRRLAVVCYAGRRGIRILRRGDRRGKISPRNVTTRAIIMTTQGGMRTWIQETSPPFWREYTRGRIFWTHTTRQQARSGTATT